MSKIKKIPLRARIRKMFQKNMAKLPIEVKTRLRVLIIFLLFVFIVTIVFSIMEKSVKSLLVYLVVAAAALSYYLWDQIFPFFLNKVTVIEGDVIEKKKKGQIVPDKAPIGFLDPALQDFRRLYLDIRSDMMYYKIPVNRLGKYHQGDHIYVYLLEKDIRKVSDNSYQTGPALYVKLGTQNIEGQQ